MSLAVPGFTWIGSNITNGNDYVDNGQQPKILLHMTVSTSLSASYAQNHPYPPQTWANPYTGERWQSIELDRAGLALYQPPYNNSWMNKNWYCSQTELVGYPVVNEVTYTEDQSKWIGENVIGPIWQAFQSVGVNVNLDNYRYHTDSSGSASEYWGGRMGDDEYFNFNGVLCHIDAFGNDHWDCSVERVDKWVAYAKQWLGQGGVVIPPDPSGGGGGTPPSTSTAPAFPGTYLQNYTSGGGTAQWQQQMANRGWSIDVDDEYGPASEQVCIQFQSEKGLDVDGIVGPITWDAAWTAPVT